MSSTNFYSFCLCSDFCIFLYSCSSYALCSCSAFSSQHFCSFFSPSFSFGSCSFSSLYFGFFFSLYFDFSVFETNFCSDFSSSPRSFSKPLDSCSVLSLCLSDPFSIVKSCL